MPPENHDSNPQPTSPDKQPDQQGPVGDIEPPTQPAYQPPSLIDETMRPGDTKQASNPEQKSKNSYYKNGGHKVTDFLIGFFAPAVVIYILTIIAPFIYAFFYLIVIAIIILIIALFMIGRRYIAIGMIISCVVIPLIIFGSCLLMFANFKA